MSENKSSRFPIESEEDKARITEIVLSSLLTKCVDVFSTYENEREKLLNTPVENAAPGFYKYLQIQKQIRKKEIAWQKDIPPADALVRFCEIGEGFSDPRIIKVWHLRHNVLTEVGDLEINTRLEPRKGMYYSQASFRIAVDLVKGEAHFMYTMGPLFGRGYSLKIEFVGDTPYLGEEIMTMIS